ncbi:hypothetical protein Tco_1156239 [Tanacetum coccineum]
MDHKSLQHIFSQKELNMRHRRWIELFSDYDCKIRHHPGTTNVMDNALSRKERVKPKRVRAMNLTLQSSIKDRILAAQKVTVDESAGLQKGLDEGKVRTLIMDKAHKSKYSVHPGADKMYYDLRDSDDEASNHEDASDTGVAPKQQQQVIPQTTAISNIKLPILKKEEYDIWAMEMEHYLEYIDNDVWKIIQNGNSKKRISTGKDGIVRILSLVTAAEIQAVEKERKKD